jgi:hypothetical protein
MNITKAPCLAYISHPVDTRFNMFIVSVLYQAPEGEFILPSGIKSAENSRPGMPRWVCKAEGSKLPINFTKWPSSNVEYVVIHDMFLRELKGDEAPELIDAEHPIDCEVLA